MFAEWRPGMKEQISKIVAEAVKAQEWKSVFDLIEIPPDYKMGDFAIPCGTFAYNGNWKLFV